MAVGNAMESAMNLFRYRSSSTYYTNGDTAMDTNWWKLASQTMNYVELGVWGVAAVTQLLATFGMMNDINLLVWMYVVGVVGGLTTGLMGIFYELAYDTAYTNMEDTSKTTAVRTAATAVYASVW